MNSFTKTAFVLVCIAVTARPASATDKTFTGGSDAWNVGGNWTPNGEPSSSDNVTVPYDQHPYIPAEYHDAACRTLTMQVSGGNRSSLTMQTDSVLTLGNGSTLTSSVDGDILVGDQLPVAYIKINGVHTITGAGGTINLTHKAAIVPYNGSNDKLIIMGDSGCTGYPTSRSCSLTIYGNGTIAVPFDNRAFVVGTDNQELHLTTYDMTGTSYGYWVAEGGGSLRFLTDVGGACTWLIDGASTGNIYIGDQSSGVGCVAATGLLNPDNYYDFAAVNGTGWELRVFYGNNAGSFSHNCINHNSSPLGDIYDVHRGSCSSADVVPGLAIGHLNCDILRPDIVVTNPNCGSVAVLLAIGGVGGTTGKFQFDRTDDDYFFSVRSEVPKS